MKNGKKYYYLRYFRTHFLSIGLVILVLLGATYCDSMTPTLYRHMTSSFQAGKVEGLMPAALELLAYTIGSAIFFLVGNYLTSISGEAISSHLRMDLFTALQKMPFWFFTHSKNGHFLSLFNHQLQGAHNGITRTIPRIITNVMTIGMVSWQLMRTDWKVTAGFVCIVPVFIIITEALQSRLRSSYKQAHNIRSEMNDMLTSNLSAAAILSQANFGTFSSVQNSFSSSSKEMKSSHEKIAWFLDIQARIVYLLFSAGSSFAYVIAGMTLAGGDPGDFIQLITAINKLQAPMLSLGTIRMEMASTTECFEAIFQHLEDAETLSKEGQNLDENSDSNGAQPRPKLALSAWPGDITLENVEFTYPSGDIFSKKGEQICTKDAKNITSTGDVVLKDISLRIKSGSKVAIIGENGSGKTTLAMLLAGLHTPSAGLIRAAGHSYRDLERTSLRKLIAVLDQNPWFEHASIAANLRVALPSCSIEDMERVCSFADILSFINELPERFDTVIGEGAMRLSSGQRQKLALARLLLKNPSVFILDEFNSHLDTRTESQILRVLFQQFANATIIMISHRFSVLRKVDQIIHLKDGKLLECGSHDELIAKNGPYAEIYREYRDGL